MQSIDMSTIKDIIATNDVREAVRLLVFLKKSPKIEIDQNLLMQLQYVRMNSLTPSRLLDLLRASVLACYSIPNSLLSEKLKEYLIQLDSVPEEIDFFEKFIKLLETDEELIANSKLVVKGQPFIPSIKNFIADFNSSTNDFSNKDALVEIRYFSNSPYINSLPEERKFIARDIIKSYNYAKSSLQEWNSIPEIKSPEEKANILKNFDLYKAIPWLEEYLEEEIENESQTVAPKTIFQTSQPTQSTQVTQPVQSQRVIRNNTPPVGTDTQQAKIDRNLQVGSDENEFKIPQQRDLDLSRQAKRGLVFDEPTNVDLTEVAKRREEELKKQRAIDEKLNALKQRKQK